MNYWSCVLSAFWLFRLVERLEIAEGFSPLHYHGSNINRIIGSSFARTTRLFDGADANTDPHKVEGFEDWSDERKSSLFQFLLRDLEIEGVPLLGCDGVSANKTLQGATWTVAGQLSENEFERKVCLVLEDVPINDLKIFVRAFSELKTRQSMMDALHDLRRFSLSLVGNGIGPGLILETANKTASEIAEYTSMAENTAAPNEAQWKAAMESFVGRCFPELGDQPIAYRFLGSSDVCDILSGYWNCICELDASDANSIVLSFPPSTSSEEAETTTTTTTTTHTRFAAISELLNAMNALYRSEYKYELIHFHPSYDRDEISPRDEPASGHLAPTGLLRDTIGEKLSEEQLALRNYQRRSPLPGVVIQRAPNTSEDGALELDCENAIRLATEGKEALEQALVEERQLIREAN